MHVRDEGERVAEAVAITKRGHIILAFLALTQHSRARSVSLTNVRLAQKGKRNEETAQQGTTRGQHKNRRISATRQRKEEAAKEDGDQETRTLRLFFRFLLLRADRFALWPLRGLELGVPEAAVVAESAPSPLLGGFGGV